MIAQHRYQQNVTRAQRKQWLILSMGLGRNVQKPFQNCPQAALGLSVPCVCYEAISHASVSLHHVGAL